MTPIEKYSRWAPLRGYSIVDEYGLCAGRVVIPDWWYTGLSSEDYTFFETAYLSAGRLVIILLKRTRNVKDSERIRLLLSYNTNLMLAWLHSFDGQEAQERREEHITT